MATPTASSASPESPDSLEAPAPAGTPSASTAGRTTRVAGSRWRPAPSTVRRLALAALVANIGIVATGGLVRLTNSGLGCPSWPDCAAGDLVPTQAVSWHKAVEFGNRMLTYVVLAAVVAVFVAVLRARPVRADAKPWAWVTLLGVPAQAVLGGITVLTDLNPWAVAAHFLLSMSLIGAATVLWWRTREPRPSPPATAPVVAPLIRRLGVATWALTYLVFAVGTVVTGSGPHAGDAKAARIHLRPGAVSQLHADLVMLLVGLAVSLAVVVTAISAPAVVRGTTRLLVAALAAQAAVGFSQYFSGLPTPLVELHVTGAALLAAAATAVVLALYDGRAESARSRSNPGSGTSRRVTPR